MELRQEETRQLFYWHENLKTTSISVSSLLICMGRRDQRIYSTKFEKLQIHKNLPAASAIPDWNKAREVFPKLIFNTMKSGIRPHFSQWWNKSSGQTSLAIPSSSLYPIFSSISCIAVRSTLKHASPKGVKDNCWVDDVVSCGIPINT